LQNNEPLGCSRGEKILYELNDPDFLMVNPSLPKYLPKMKLTQAVMFMNCILETQGSNRGENIDYPDRAFPGSSQSL
jgi:hypothetical protein